MGAIRMNTVILLVLFSQQITCIRYTDVYQLQNNLLQNYSITIRPVLDQSSPVNVNVAYMMKALNDFDVVQGRLTLIGAFVLTWIDENIKWDPSSYGNVTSLRLSNTKVWTPDIVIMNGADSVKVTNGHSTDVLFTKDGIASIALSGVVTLTCNPYIKFYPYDVHTCPIQIGFMETSREMTLSTTSQTILSPFTESNTMWTFAYVGWESTSGSVTQSLAFNLVLERRPAYLMLVLVIPVCILYLFNLLVFALPVETGERLSFGMTILLTLSVYMTIMSDSIPNTSDPVSILSVSLLVKLICSGLMSLVNVLILIVYNQPDEKPVPDFFKQFVTKTNTRKIHVEANRTIQVNAVEKMAINYPRSKNEVDNAHSNSPEIDTSTDNQYSKRVISWGSVGKKLDVFGLVFFTCMCMFDVILTLTLIIWRLG